MSAMSAMSVNDPGAETSFQPPSVDPDLARYFREQAAKSAHLDNFQMLITKYQNDPDTTDDESDSSPPRTGLQSPPPSPIFKASLTHSHDYAPGVPTTNQANTIQRSLSLGHAPTSALSPPTKPTLQIMRRAIMAKRTTRLQYRPTTTFLQLDDKGRATVIDFVVSNSLRPARIQRRRRRPAQKPY